uniref:PA2c domain-containing protein n=1 Tax=Rhabditophanes sp. KR3021 TaxID=114890 RepID=A0AC35TX23_9BILA
MGKLKTAREAEFLIFDLKTDPEVQKRLELISKEKFEHNYAIQPNGTVIEEVKKHKIDKRDGGLISGPVAVALVSGIIGFTTNALHDLATYDRPTSSTGGCKWYGTAPLCDYRCPSDFDFIREHNGRCSKWWFASVCEPDAAFGMPCSTFLGSYYSKRFCCKSDASDCSWSGRWMSASTSNNIHCRYDHREGVCGRFSCGINNSKHNAYNNTIIEGEGCDHIQLFNANGKATCGYIAWYNPETGDFVDAWYKSKD